MKKNRYINNSGLTLIELIVSITLVAVIILAAFTALDFGQKSFSSVSSLGDLQTQASNITAFISAQVRKCRSITSVSQSSVLMLVNKDGVNAKFEWDGASTLTYLTEGDDAKVLSTDVKYLKFNADSSGVEITLELEANGEAFRLQTSVYRRY